jgi:glycosyltransferase involved in cell wall biosynthesis
MEVSIIAPVYNEEENIHQFIDEVYSAMDGKYDYELILVDDGSQDDSFAKIEAVCSENHQVKAIKFRRNFGQTSAMAAGINYAQGDIVVFLDSDLQNDPADIPSFCQKINEGADMVVGWRKNRKDKFLTRILPSKIANLLISKLTGVSVHDLGCSLKAFKKDLIAHINLYGEMHRFIPIYTNAIGAKMVEIETNHRPRLYGQSKYGLMRTIKVMLDLITVFFFARFRTRPMYVFGSIGFGMLGLGFVTSVLMLVHKFVDNISIVRSPLLMVTAVVIILAFNFFLMGIIAELVMRTYYESQSKVSYYVRKTVNLGE